MLIKRPLKYPTKSQPRQQRKEEYVSDLYRSEKPAMPTDLIGLIGIASFSAGVYSGLVYHTQGMKAITIMGLVLMFYLFMIVYSRR